MASNVSEVGSADILLERLSVDDAEAMSMAVS